MGLSFKVKIINRKFRPVASAAGSQLCQIAEYDTTACVSFYDDGRYTGTRLYGYFDYIKNLKHLACGTVNLNGAFVDSFGVSAPCGKNLRITALDSFWNGITNLSQILFEENANFQGAFFAGNVSFSGAVFTQLADFSGCTFGGCVDFGNVIFKKDATFSKARFDDELQMARTECGGGLNLSGGQFAEAADLTYMRVYEEIDMSHIQASSHLILKRIHCRRLSLYSATLGSQTDIILKRCTEIMLNECNTGRYMTIRFGEELRKLSLLDMAIEGSVSISGPFQTVKRCIGQSIYYDYPAGRGSNPISVDCGFWEQAEQYNTLKQIYSSTGRYDFEDRAYREYRRSKRRAIPSPMEILRTNESHHILPVIQGLWRWCILKPLEYICLDLFGGYGTSPVRTIWGIITTIILFGLIYSLPAAEFIYASAAQLSLPDYIYISGTAFFTIGFGDIIPANLTAKLLTICEGFAGVFLMSYFTVSFARRTLR